LFFEDEIGLTFIALQYLVAGDNYQVTPLLRNINIEGLVVFNGKKILGLSLFALYLFCGIKAGHLKADDLDIERTTTSRFKALLETRFPDATSDEKNYFRSLTLVHDIENP